MQQINLKNRSWKHRIKKSITVQLPEHFIQRIFERIVHNKQLTNQQLLDRLNNEESNCVLSKCLSDGQMFLYLRHTAASIPVRFDSQLNCWVAVTIESDVYRVRRNTGIDVHVEWLLINDCCLDDVHVELDVMV